MDVVGRALKHGLLLLGAVEPANRVLSTLVMTGGALTEGVGSRRHRPRASKRPSQGLVAN